ncbi:MAG: hypothetical protein SF162_16965 [bacterium]|nr:hypothetical protein [bacterium]
MMHPNDPVRGGLLAGLEASIHAEQDRIARRTHAARSRKTAPPMPEMPDVISEWVILPETAREWAEAASLEPETIA